MHEITIVYLSMVQNSIHLDSLIPEKTIYVILTKPQRSYIHLLFTVFELKIFSSLIINYFYVFLFYFQRSPSLPSTAPVGMVTSPTRMLASAIPSSTVWTASSTWSPAPPAWSLTPRPASALGLTRPRRRDVDPKVLTDLCLGL